MRRLILPAEIKSRELDARLLQAVLAVGRGYEVVVGAKAAVNRRIWRYDAGVYLCQTLTRGRATLLGLLERLGIPAVGWCEEGLVYQSTEVYLERRVAPDTVRRLAALVAWGERSRLDLDRAAAPFGLAAQALGNPRLDLLRPELRALFAPEAAAITARLGDFILFNTNFSNVNCAPEATARNRGSAKDSAHGTRYDEFKSHRALVFDAFRRELPRLAAALPHHRLVIRPHPAENVAPWLAVAEQAPNVVVERSGGVVPWLLAASALVHNGCTTAVEAALLDRPAIAFCADHRPDLEAVLANEVSHRAFDADELIARTRAALDGELAPTTAQRAVLDRFVAARTGPLATERILDLIDDVEKGAAAAPALRRAGARVQAILRHAAKTLRRGHQTERYAPTVFPETPAVEIEARARAIAALACEAPLELSCRRIAANVFVLTGAKR